MFAFNPKRTAQTTFVIFAFTLVASSHAACTTPTLPASTPTLAPATVRLFATTPTLPLVNDLAASYAMIAPNVQFEISVGAYDEMRRRAREAERQMTGTATAAESGYLLTNHLSSEADLPWAAPIGQDGLAVIVPRGQTATGLSLAGLRDIYTGAARDWVLFGGTGPIVPFVREAESGTGREFAALVLGETGRADGAGAPPAGPRIAPGIAPRIAPRIAPGSALMVEAVASTPGAVGYVSMAYLNPPYNTGVRALAIEGVLPTAAAVADGSYPLRAYLYIAGPREPMGALRSFIGWVQSAAGQAVVARHHAPLTLP